MPNTRKRVIKTVYKDEVSESETGDFSDSGSEAQFSEQPSSEDEEIEEQVSSADEFVNKSIKKRQKQPIKTKQRIFSKEFLSKINKQNPAETEENEIPLSLFSVKDLTEADKLLPSVLNLSESDSSDDEAPKPKKAATFIPYSIQEQEDSDNEAKEEYTDVWSTNTNDNSADIAKKTFMELERHKTTIENTKASIQSYVPRSSMEREKESKVTDLLALGEEVVPQEKNVKKKQRPKKNRDDSESEVEDWEEVKESKAIPQQGLQLVVALPDSICRKSKKLDLEMMMKRKINRVKKEHQVFMHKVHVLCWIGHGNYVNRVLNDQEIMAAVIAMVPKGCYPEDRLNMKYVEQIAVWFKDKLTLKEDKNENKFKPKAPPLRNILLDQIKKRTVSARKYSVFIFVAMLRALGLQCRIMFNFVTVPIRPPSSELCSLSTKSKDEKHVKKEETSKVSQTKSKTSDNKTIPKSNKSLPQVDGIDDSCISNDSECDNIMQVDGNDDTLNIKTRSLRSTRAKKIEAANANKAEENESVSPPKRSKKELPTKTNITTESTKLPQRKRANNNIGGQSENEHSNKNDLSSKSLTKSSMPVKTLEVPKSPVSKGIKQDGKGKSPERINANKGKGDDSESVSKIKTNGNEVTSKSIKSNTIKKPELSMSPQKINDKSNKDVSVHISAVNKTVKINTIKSPKSLSLKTTVNDENSGNISKGLLLEKVASPRKTRRNSKITPQEKTISYKNKTVAEPQNKKDLSVPKILITHGSKETSESKYFAIKGENSKQETKGRSTRKRSHTEVVNGDHQDLLDVKTKTRTRSAPGSKIEKSKYFDDANSEPKKSKLSLQKLKLQEKLEDAQRVSHRGLAKSKAKPKNDVTGDLVNIIKGRIKGAKEEAKKGIVKGKVKQESDDDSDYLPVEDRKPRDSESDEDFKPTKISPKAIKLSPGARPSTSKKRLDRRVLSSEDDAIMSRKANVWCEIFVEELEQWIAVDVIKGKVHCTNDFYSQATHPVCYVVGWDNNNYLKDLTRRYVPHWNTVTRKQRAEPEWWNTAVQPWLGPRNARDKEEDESLDRMQLEAPLPKSIAEYKNHPLYALKRHLLKYEALYPPDATTLGFVRNEPVYARECVYTCRSRDTWLKEAKVVKLGQSPYKVVKARPKWDRLSNKLITDKPLEIFGPWQVQDYEPPTAENGIVPRNAYGNVELFKDCMLPKGTVHVKLPGLNKVARKLNIDCAPAMTGFDFNGGWSHPVYDGFVVCKEYEEIITEAWVKDQEEQERREIEKMELRVYGNWKRLIKGLLIRERLKHKYGFEKPSTSQPAKNKKGPRLVCKKKP